MGDENLEMFFKTAMRLVRQAGALIRERTKSRNTSAITKSSDIDLVTETDQEVENLIVEGIGKDFPDHKFIAEETVSKGGKCILTDSPTWIIDPIDGTMNFVHLFPHSCISLGLFIEKEPALGIIYNPILEQLFTAKKGQGAYLNDNKITVSKETKLAKALIMMETGTSREPIGMNAVWENQKKIIPIVHGVRSLGSAALNMAMVACGGADAYFEYGVHIWDFAAGELIVKEAGGFVCDPAGGKIDRMSRRMLCASTEEIGMQLVKVLTQYYPEPRDD